MQVIIPILWKVLYIKQPYVKNVFVYKNRFITSNVINFGIFSLVWHTLVWFIWLLVCWFGFFFRPTREIFTLLETTLIAVKGYKFWPFLGTRVNSAVWFLSRVTPNLTRANPLWRSSLSTRNTDTWCRAFGSGTFTTGFNYIGLSQTGIAPRSPHASRTL